MLSIVVNFFNNRREAQNTLHSLSRGYQRDAQDIPYEVLVVDNGSTQPLAETQVSAFGPEFRYRYVETKSVSPVAALNAVCRQAAGDNLLVMIDGAHIMSPGVLRSAQDAFCLFPSAFAATVPFHLGPKKQNESILEGYNQLVEDQLLYKSGWRSNGYRLYAIAGSFMDGSEGWFGCLYESGCFGISKADYLAMGGFDERFQSPGGGLANLDFFKRALLNTKLHYVMLLGQATFHQTHGGVTSCSTAARNPWQDFEREYMQIRGIGYQRAPRRPFFMGNLPKECLNAARVSSQNGLDFWQKLEVVLERNAQFRGQ